MNSTTKVPSLVRKTVTTGSAGKKGASNLHEFTTNCNKSPVSSIPPGPTKINSAGQMSSSAVHMTLAGGISGAICTVVGHPFDTIKVRIQTENQAFRTRTGLRIYEMDEYYRIQLRHLEKTGRHSISHHNAFRSFFTCGTKILRNEGFFGFYRGMLYPILSQIPTCAATLFGYHIGGQLYNSIVPLSPGEFSNQKIAISGFIAGFLNAVVSCPIDRVKCLLQIQTGSKAQPNVTNKYRGPFHCAKQVYLEEGFMRGSYKGFGITLIRRVPGYAIHFLVYENIKRFFQNRHPNRNVSGLELFVAGGLGGFVSCLYWIAPDTLKTRIQTSKAGQYPKGMRSLFKEMRLQREPMTSLFRGLPPVIIRSFPVNAVYMFSVEFILKRLSIHEKNRELHRIGKRT